MFDQHDNFIVYKAGNIVDRTGINGIFKAEIFISSVSAKFSSKSALYSDKEIFFCVFIFAEQIDKNAVVVTTIGILFCRRFL